MVFTINIGYILLSILRLTSALSPCCVRYAEKLAVNVCVFFPSTQELRISFPFHHKQEQSNKCHKINVKDPPPSSPSLVSIFIKVLIHGCQMQFDRPLNQHFKFQLLLIYWEKKSGWHLVVQYRPRVWSLFMCSLFVICNT